MDGLMIPVVGPSLVGVVAWERGAVAEWPPQWVVTSHTRTHVPEVARLT